MSCVSKIIVFDLDETLGYFTQFGIFWDAIHGYITQYNLNIIMNQSLFNKLLDLYPEFLRPNIFSILNYLKNNKKNNNCKKLLIYTNNQGPKEWAQHIKLYFEEKINYNLFDQIIGAFQVNGKRVEICRTSNSKSKSDLIRCSKIDENSKICVIDDAYYPDMTDDNIYYVNIKPYIHDLPFELLIDRFIRNKIISIQHTNNLKTFLLNFIKRYNYIYVKKNKIEYNVDKAISKKIYQHLVSFFDNKLFPISKLTKHRRRIINKTKKHRSKG